MEIIREGDKVEIVNPVFVRRVGYPLCLDDGVKAVSAIAGAEIERLLGMFHHVSHLAPPYSRERNRRAIERALASEWLRSQGYGGRERSLHLVERPEFKGKVAWVRHMKTRHTGTYQPGHTYNTIDGCESDPPYLDKISTHRIATLDFHLEFDTCDGKTWFDAQVEVTNLKKYETRQP